MKKMLLITSIAGLAMLGAAHAAGDAEAGKAKSAMCLACHGADGNSAAPNFPKLAGQHADYIAAQLRAYRLGYEDESGRTNDGEAMIMRTTAFGLSDREIDAVASYASGLK